jgi:hypothetical protein
MMELLEGLNRQQGVTILTALHDLQHATWYVSSKSSNIPASQANSRQPGLSRPWDSWLLCFSARERRGKGANIRWYNLMKTVSWASRGGSDLPAPGWE